MPLPLQRPPPQFTAQAVASPVPRPVPGVDVHVTRAQVLVSPSQRLAQWAALFKPELEVGTKTLPRNLLSQLQVLLGVSACVCPAVVLGTSGSWSVH